MYRVPKSAYQGLTSQPLLPTTTIAIIATATNTNLRTSFPLVFTASALNPGVLIGSDLTLQFAVTELMKAISSLQEGGPGRKRRRLRHLALVKECTSHTIPFRASKDGRGWTLLTSSPCWAIPFLEALSRMAEGLSYEVSWVPSLSAPTLTHLMRLLDT